MENAGQSESSPKILKCSHPYSSSVDFKVELGVCNNGWKYNLNFDARNNYVISRHNSEEHFVLNHNKYEITLKQWLVKEENQYNWCDYYATRGLYRPKEEAKKVIQGILRAVCELHSHNSFHGFLYHPENFAIQDNEVAIGGDHEKNKHIFLIHENHELKHASTNNSTQLGDRQLSDRRAVSDVIFTQILGNWQKPQDLQDLDKLLRKTKVTSHDWNLIVNHPSLWHWESRFDYIGCVWMHFVQANEDERRRMKKEFNKINVMGWRKNIPQYSPLENVYDNSHYRRDRETVEDLIRFIRNVRIHYKENVKHHHAREYNEPQFIEVQITKLNELLLVKLYDIMC